MIAGAASRSVWGDDDRQLATVARNVTTRYLMIGIDALLGMLLLPFNVHHLGQSAYGLWMLTTSMTTYFSILDLGFGGSVVKFAAEYRARRDARGLNEIASTMVVLFSGVGIVAYVVFAAIAYHLRLVFNIDAQQAEVGRLLVLAVGLYVSLGFPFSIFGGIINAFQRYDVNNAVGIGTSLVIAVVNVAMLLAGFSLVQLVMVTTGIRILAYIVYRLNAYWVFPALSVRLSLFRWARFRELTSFSLYVAMIDWANRLNYSLDALVIGAYLSPVAVAVWTVPQRIAEALQRLTNQLNSVLFPVVVDSDATQRIERLRAIFIHGTRLSLVSVVPLTAALMLLARPLIETWVGPKFEDSILVTQILVAVVAIRVGCATATTVLKGAGGHRLLAGANMGAAIANLALSLLWIRRFGLVGQALGTLIPVAVVSCFVLWPAGCRRVNLGVGDAFRAAVWPAVWPITAMALAIVPMRAVLPPRLIAIGAAVMVGCIVYAATFVTLAVGDEDRRAYIEKALALVGRSRRMPVAA